jgi:Lectin C-type domain
LYVKLENWTYNFNYWTSATQKGSKGQWAWCTGQTTALLPDNLTWAFNQPDNKAGGEDCIQMRLTQNATGIALSDRNCTNKFVIACEV